ncbi:alpha/beta hydrolase [Lutispora sp.]|uniref:alpha/beta hydrolase n=1 Tax=Lutispora sp. TaxID=2828727 RepID=UPI000EC83CDB|nr:alpha/beta fold hydrolase [Lutispora sp.]MEA4962131.1 alpha/beta fold hydrolase [Lutispora sp.]HCJ57996.1 esterase [Clostridiaceae bacterium]
MQHNRIGYLVIHGFGGSKYEVEPFTDHLIEKNCEVACPMLKGHTGKRRDMKNATYKDWIDSAEQELLKLKESSDEIVLIGFSMGGLIAVNLACKHQVKAVITINTPIYYWNFKIVLNNLIEDIKSKSLNNFNRYFYAGMKSPIAAMYNFQLLLAQTKPKINKIHCPFLIMQAEDDDTVRIRSVDYIYNNLPSENKKIKLYNKGGHLILRSPTANQVIADINAFLYSLP